MMKWLQLCDSNYVHNEVIWCYSSDVYDKMVTIYDSNYVRNEVIWCYSSDNHMKKFIMVLQYQCLHQSRYSGVRAAIFIIGGCFWLYSYNVENKTMYLHQHCL